ncbi:ATP-binding protein [Streptomyces sp. NPDC048383]|uniref:ATP-binding protein n=1 Tax=Streptomyces sp. NPDC048383 TaxID=3155386 RepID=UPI0034377FD0
MSQTLPPVSDLMLAATPNAVAWARRHTVDILRTWSFPTEGTEVARLLVSELATNAIRHARPPGTAATDPAVPGTILLRMWPTNGGIVLLVGDNDPQLPVPRRPSNSATGGRGLLLTAAMASRWGYYSRHPHPGKFVWAEIPARPEEALGDQRRGQQETTPLLLGQVLTALREL